MTTAIQCPFAVYDYPCDKPDCSRGCPIRVAAVAKAGEGKEPEEAIGGKCFFCGKFTPHDSGHNLRYIGGHGDVYVCPECQQ